MGKVRLELTGHGRHPFLVALEPVAAALGAELLEPADMEPSDILLEWDGCVVGALRMLPLQGALNRLIDGLERELGVSRITVYNYLNAMRGEPLRPA